MKRVAIVIALVAFWTPGVAFAQLDNSVPPSQPTLRSFFPDLVGDFKRLPSTEAAVSVAAGGILSASLSPLDDNVLNWEPNDAFGSGQWIGNPFVLAGAGFGWNGKPHASSWALAPAVGRSQVALNVSRVFAP